MSSPQHGSKLSLYLYEMLHDHKDSLTKDEQNAVGVFMTSLKLCGHRYIPPNEAHKQDLLKAIKDVRSEVFGKTYIATGNSQNRKNLPVSSYRLIYAGEI